MFNGTVQQLVLEVWLAMILYGNKQFIIGLVTNNWKKNLSFYISGSLYGLIYLKKHTQKQQTNSK